MSTSEKYCVICLNHARSINNNIINPCLCKNYNIHEECFKDWRKQNISNSKFSRCEACQYKYQTESTMTPDQIRLKQLCIFTVLVVSPQIVYLYIIEAITILLFLLGGFNLSKVTI